MIKLEAGKPYDHMAASTMGRQRAADAAHLCLDALQNMDAEDVVMGSAVLFAALCKQLGLNPEELHGMASKVLRYEPNHRRTNDSVQSLLDFIRLRIKGDVNVTVS